MTLAKREIDVTIHLGTGKFGDEVGDTVTLSGYRVVCHINEQGGNSPGQTHVKIYGLPLEVMNQLTTIGQVAGEIRAKNIIQIDAGNEGEALQTVYIGNIWTAYAGFEEAPDVPLVIKGIIGNALSVKPVSPTSYKGAIDAAKCMQDFATEAGLQFENNGVSVQLSNPYFSGPTLTKIRECAHAARINWHIDNNTTLAIWPARGSRQGPTPIVNSQNGMIGYPAFGSQYISVITLFRTDIMCGTRFQIEGSENIKANGEWIAIMEAHHLESQKPNGAWFTELNAMMGT